MMAGFMAGSIAIIGTPKLARNSLLATLLAVLQAITIASQPSSFKKRKA